MTAVEVLRAVRARLEDPKKWAQGAHHIGEASCLLGHLDIVTDQLPKAIHATAWSALYQEIPRRLGEPRPCVSDWNDRVKTKHADVLALLDRAIASLEGQPK